MQIPLALLLPLFASLASVKAAGGSTCSSVSHCSASAPCCSEFGYCGTDNFCLGGCNPLASNALTSCTPEPVCKNANFVFADNSRILSNATFFSGNASKYDWVLDKGNIMNTNANGGELVLLLTETNGGTRLSSTRYVHYGTITATLKTGRWNGVVTAFITMSDIKDEIDWEFPGSQVTAGQSNYFWQGVIPPQTNGQTHTGLTDTYANYHNYTINWTPDALTFLVDGALKRTVPKTSSQYPNTPSRIQLSLWPAGIPSSPPGTVQWAGGMINWNDPDYVSAGHFYMLVKSVSITCADPQHPTSDITSYVYGANTSANTPGISFSNSSTLVNGATAAHAGFPMHVVFAFLAALLLGEYWLF